MLSADEIIHKLKAKARPEQLKGMARFAIVGEGRLGVSVPEMRKLAKEIGKDHQLALKLWRSGIPEARIVAGMIGDPEELTEQQMDSKAARWIASDAIRELESEGVQQRLKKQ
jgi:3-methyladenine DNA glycosylase AlkD